MRAAQERPAVFLLLFWGRNALPYTAFFYRLHRRTTRYPRARPVCAFILYRYLLSYRRAYISLSRVSSGSGLARSRETACVSLEKKKKQKSEIH